LAAADLSEKAEELSLLYLPDDTEERRRAFCKLYMDTMRSSSAANLNDLDILRSYLLFDADSLKALPYLISMANLKEMGFEEERISSALLMFNCNQEEALEHLMKD
jgi:hypothetical protein